MKLSKKDRSPCGIDEMRKKKLLAHEDISVTPHGLGSNYEQSIITHTSSYHPAHSFSEP